MNITRDTSHACARRTMHPYLRLPAIACIDDDILFMDSANQDIRRLEILRVSYDGELKIDIYNSGSTVLACWENI